MIYSPHKRNNIQMTLAGYCMPKKIPDKIYSCTSPLSTHHPWFTDGLHLSSSLDIQNRFNEEAAKKSQKIPTTSEREV
jgi:hypothetical protein